MTGVPPGSPRGVPRPQGPQALLADCWWRGVGACVWSPTVRDHCSHFSRAVSRFRVHNHPPYFQHYTKAEFPNFYHFNSVFILMVHPHLQPHYHWLYSHLTYEAQEAEKSKYFAQGHTTSPWQKQDLSSDPPLRGPLPPHQLAGPWGGLESVSPIPMGLL